jgi:acyl-CoA hydrolase
MPREGVLESAMLHLVRPEDLNHHGTMFAGKMALWLVEAGLIAASRLCGKPENVVCVQLDGMRFKKPVNNGDLIEIKSKIAFLGSTSLIVSSEVFRKQDADLIVTNMAVFVTVGKDNKPYPHGFKLTDDYITANRGIYEQALKIRAAK